MSFLFGSSPSVQNEPIYLQSSLSGGQTSAANTLTNILTGLSSGAGASQSLYPSYTGQVGAPVSDTTTQAVNALKTLIPSLSTDAQKAGTVQAQGQSTLSDLLTRTPSSYQSYYDKNVFSPLLSAFGGNAASDIISATGGTGASAGGTTAGGGAPTNAAVDRALSQFGTTLGKTQSDLALKTAVQNPSNILSALQTLQSVTGAPISSLTTALSGGVSGQQAQQNYLDALYKNWQQGNSSTSQFISDLIGYLKVQTQVQANQNTAVSGSSGLLGSLLGSVGGAAAGTALGNSLFGGAASGAVGGGLSLGAAGGADASGLIGLAAAAA